MTATFARIKNSYIPPVKKHSGIHPVLQFPLSSKVAAGSAGQCMVRFRLVVVAGTFCRRIGGIVYTMGVDR